MSEIGSYLGEDSKDTEENKADKDEIDTQLQPL
jgi:hypothetical protein